MGKDVFLCNEREPAWALLYTMTWPESGDKVWPEIHGIYETEQEAVKAQRSKINPKSYHVRRAHWWRFED